ncbi:MAG TPA: YifB family Mg chelatase-like AAA ATPase [Nevskiaceae bacterium]
MGLATVLSRAQNGLKADLVRVEVHVASGLPSLSVVGLPEAAVREARDRVRAAIVNSGYRFPDGRITVNLAPADLPKEGGRFDLPIALGILAASRQVPDGCLAQVEAIGELSLGGEVQAVRGVLPTALRCVGAGHGLLVPAANVAEARLVRELEIHGARRLSELGVALNAGPLPPAPAVPPPQVQRVQGPDLLDVRGQRHARRALEVAAAGGHSLLMVGPPGSGKSMLATRLPGILPPLNEAEAIEVAAIASIDRGQPDLSHWGERPFRSPHHSASAVALVGGGSVPRPGEITLAHRGVLFLDELPEFDRRVLEVLREPLENGTITISRAARQVDFPARFQLVAAMNPCPCGYLGDSSGRCHCSPERIARYRARLSGPFLDRIDLQVFVPRIEREALTARQGDGESSAVVRQRVVAARALQHARAGKPNASLGSAELERDARPTAGAAALLRNALERLALSARAYHRTLRVARTIADLAGAEAVDGVHVAEAVRYRELDRSSAPA